MSLIVAEKRTTQFERGFKTWSETTSETLRRQLKARNIDPLDPRDLAKHLEVELWDIHEIAGVTPETLNHLTSEEGNEWSALTVSLGSRDVIVINPTHGPARQASDITHELAHIIRQHKPAQHFISPETGIVMRTYNGTQEDEANWLAGCLLLPRCALAYHAACSTDRTQMCELYGVSVELLRYRLNVTGLHKSFAH